MQESERRVYIKPAEVDTQLAGLGLTAEDLTLAIREGDNQAGFCTDNDPSVLKNFTRWGKTFRGLADRLTLKNQGWRKEERRCFPLMVSKDRSIAITVSSGDALTGQDTGRDGPKPHSQNPKGTLTKQVVNENQGQLPGFEDAVARLPVEGSGQITWFLLYCLDRLRSEIRCELSLPEKVDDSDVISSWFARIILPPISLSVQAGIGDEDEGDDQIDITIKPKG